MSEYYDCVFIGGGFSGIGMAVQFIKQFPFKSYIILEARNEIGGWWSSTKFPGVNSTTPITTLSYSGIPWLSRNYLPPSAEVLKYIKDVAAGFGCDQHVKTGVTVSNVNFDSDLKVWNIFINDDTHPRFKSSYIALCSGEHENNKVFQPNFKNANKFKGDIIHSLSWPSSVELKDKRVVIIGSGQTSVTIAPSLVKDYQIAELKIIQRSPSYYCPVPRVIDIEQRGWRAFLIKNCPSSMFAWKIFRIFDLIVSYIFYLFCVMFPRLSSSLLIQQTLEAVLPSSELKAKLHFHSGNTPSREMVSDSDPICVGGPGVTGDALNDQLRLHGLILTGSSSGAIIPESRRKPLDKRPATTCSTFRMKKNKKNTKNPEQPGIFHTHQEEYHTDDNNLPSKTQESFNANPFESTKNFITSEEARVHFTPPYLLYENNLCMDVDGSFLRCVREGEIQITTGTIQEFCSNGIVMENEQTIEADVIIYATGKDLVPFGNIHISIDKQPIILCKHLTYQNCMLEDVPNCIFIPPSFFTAASVRLNLIANFFCKAIKKCEASKKQTFVPRTSLCKSAAPIRSEATAALSACSALLRTCDLFPQQGDRSPWKGTEHSYVLDLWNLKLKPFGWWESKALKFEGDCTGGWHQIVSRAIEEQGDRYEHD